MSRLTTICPQLSVIAGFHDSITFDNKLLFTGQDSVGDHIIQWINEGDTVWKSLGRFNDLTDNFGEIDFYNPGSGSYAIGADFTRNFVFFSNSVLDIACCSFDSDGNLTPLGNNTFLNRTFGGKIGVDTVRKLIFVADSDNIHSYSYSEDGLTITYLSTSPYSTACQDLVLDTVNQFIFGADKIPSKGIISLSYDAFGVMTPIGSYSATNHGYGAIQIDVANQKLFACHWYFNSPTGMEILSYNGSGVVTPVSSAAPISGSYDQGETIVVDSTRSLVFIAYTDSFVIKIASFSFDASFNLTPVAVYVTSFSSASHSSIDVINKYIILSIGSDGIAKIEYNDTGTTFDEITQSSPSFLAWNTLTIPADEFTFVTRETGGLYTYSYTSYLERNYYSLIIFEGDVYASADSALVRLDYVDPSWTATRVCNVISGESWIYSLGVHDGRLYGTAGGYLYRMNIAKDAWELVAPEPSGIPSITTLTSFNSRLYGTGSGKLFRLNLAGNAWEEVIGATGGTANSLGIHNNNLYMTSSLGASGNLYVLNDTEDDWILLASAGASYVLTKPISYKNLIFIGGFNPGYLQPASAYYYLESKSVLRTVAFGIDNQNVLQAPVIMNDKLYFGTQSGWSTPNGSGRLFRLDLTLPAVTNMYLWEKDQYFYGWAGIGMGNYEYTVDNTEENISVDPIWPARSIDGVVWDEISVATLLSPLYGTERFYYYFYKENYAPNNLFVSFNNYLYIGGNRKINDVPEWSASINRSSNGTSWTEVFLSADVSTVKSLLVYNNEIYAAVQVTEATHTASKIYKSSNGTSWGLIKTLDEGAGTELIVEALTEYNGDMYMIMNSYVYVSTDNGLTWANTYGYIETNKNPNSIIKDNFIYFYASGLT